ncbi:sulfatase-like hydrolase/transferase, partial [Planctomycetota bacterium]
MRIGFTFTCCLLTVFGVTFAADSQKTDRPNIVLILTDDMGFSDIGCYGGEIQTPQIDRLAENGLKFSQFYNCGKCEPSRAALTTGHQWWAYNPNVAMR